MKLELPSNLLDRLNVAQALRASIDHPPVFVPSYILDGGVDTHFDEAVGYFEGLSAAGLHIEPGEVIQARKTRFGLRPAVVLGFPERVAFEALVGVIEPALPPLRRSQADFDAFSTGPIEELGNRGVVTLADVSSFYEYVDHELLTDEIVNQTGEAQAAATLSSLLGALMDRRFGLPQRYGPSDTLSELIID